MEIIPNVNDADFQKKFRKTLNIPANQSLRNFKINLENYKPILAQKYGKKISERLLNKIFDLPI